MAFLAQRPDKAALKMRRILLAVGNDLEGFEGNMSIEVVLNVVENVSPSSEGVRRFFAMLFCWRARRFRTREKVIRLTAQN